MKTNDTFALRMTALALVSASAAIAFAMFLAGCSGDAGRTVAPSDSSQAISTSTPSGAPVPSGGTGGGLGSTSSSALISKAGVEDGTAPQPVPSAGETKAASLEGVRLFDSGDWQGASERLTVAAAGRPDDARTHYLLGLALWKSGHAADAERELALSATLNTASAKTWINLARVRLDRDDSQAALDAAEKACDLMAGSPDALHQKGRALARLGRPDEAIEILTQASGLAPDNGYIANSLGNTFLQVGRPADAVPVLELARDRLPGVAFVRNNLGVAYERTGQRDAAIAEYTAAVEAGDSGGKAAASLARLGVAPSETGIASTHEPLPATDPKQPAEQEKTVTAEPGTGGSDTDGTAGGSF